MKNRTSWLLAISVILLFVSCKKADIETDKDNGGVALYDCSQKSIDTYICFDSLITDSRCPAGMECIWQGTALIKVTFSEGDNIHHFVMSLQGFPSLGYPSDTTIDGYRIIFIDLKPHPATNRPHGTATRAFFSISP
jgi:hypothetical protein